MHGVSLADVLLRGNGWRSAFYSSVHAGPAVPSRVGQRPHLLLPTASGVPWLDVFPPAFGTETSWVSGDWRLINFGILLCFVMGWLWRGSCVDWVRSLAPPHTLGAASYITGLWSFWGFDVVLLLFAILFYSGVRGMLGRSSSL